MNSVASPLVCPPFLQRRTQMWDTINAVICNKRGSKFYLWAIHKQKKSLVSKLGPLNSLRIISVALMSLNYWEIQETVLINIHQAIVAHSTFTGKSKWTPVALRFSVFIFLFSDFCQPELCGQTTPWHRRNYLFALCTPQLFASRRKKQNSYPVSVLCNTRTLSGTFI